MPMKILHPHVTILEDTIMQKGLLAFVTAFVKFSPFFIPSYESTLNGFK